MVDTGRSSFEQPHPHPLQQQQQQTAFVHPDVERASVQGSQYDRRRESRGEKYRSSRVEGWVSPASMVSTSSPHRTHYQMAAFPGDEEEQDDGLSEDPDENAFIILVSGIFSYRLPS